VFAVVHLLTPDTLAVTERKKRKRKRGRNLFCFSAERTAASKAMVFYRDAMDAYRRQLVMSVLVQTQGSRPAAARTLGLQEKYLLRLLKSLRIGA
jgi:DNA-binding NtrC family response regulator